LPEIPFRRNPGYIPGTDEDNSFGYLSGQAGSDHHADYRMTAAERAEWKRCLKEKEARRIPLGFQLPCA
jgi:hypothetical protein